MRYYKEARLRFIGDKTRAQSYLPQARVALGELMHLHLTLGGIEQMRRTERLPDGTVFHLNANKYMPSITIDVSGGEDVLPRDIFISGYSTAPGSNFPVKAWLVGLLYNEHGLDQDSQPKKLHTPAQVVWSPNDTVAVRSAGSVANWNDLPFVVGHGVRMTGYERPLHKPRHSGRFTSLESLGYPVGGPTQERVISAEHNRMYFLYSAQSTEVPDDTRALLLRVEWPGTSNAVTLYAQGLVIQYQSLVQDDTHVWLTYQGVPATTTIPPGAVNPTSSYTLERHNKNTFGVAMLTYFSFPSTDLFTVETLRCLNSDNVTKLAGGRFRNLSDPGLGEGAWRYHPFAYLNPVNGALSIDFDSFWTLNPAITSLVVSTFYGSELDAVRETEPVVMHDSVEDGVAYTYCLMAMPNTVGGSTRRQMIIKLIPSTQTPVATLIMEDAYIMVFRSDEKDLYFNARLGPVNLSGSMTSGALRAGLFRIPKEQFFGTVDPEDVHLIWERDDPSTPEDFDLIYTGSDSESS